MNIPKRVCVLLIFQCVFAIGAFGANRTTPVVILMDKWIETIDPQEVLLIEEFLVVRQVFETLTKIDKNGDIIPLLAEKWQFGEDGKKITITLKKDIRFSDGSFLNTELVHETIKNVGRSSMINSLNKIKGLLAFKKKSKYN